MPLSKIDEAGLASSAQFTGFKNRIINGGMVIDQRNAGASVTPADQAYTLDRWVYIADQASKCTIEQTISGVSAPAGFTDYLGVTSTAATTITTSQVFAVIQRIEGYNMADLAWGTASAATVTLSFWVRSSLTGTFGGAIRNDAGNYNYPFSYTISAANTWEQKSVTITGATSGTWLTTNGRGMQLVFSLGAGATASGTAGAWSTSSFWSATGATQVLATNGATFYITGVQLEAGSVATPFERRPYGTELALCQRYTEVIKQQSSAAETLIGNGMVYTSPTVFFDYSFKIPKRAQPSLTTSGTVGQLQVLNTSGSWREASAIGTQANPDVARISITMTSFTGFTAGQACEVRIESGLTLIFSAEL
jgi:hypothetical protein